LRCAYLDHATRDDGVRLIVSRAKLRLISTSSESFIVSVAIAIFYRRRLRRAKQDAQDAKGQA
jgi:hypothetical protein